MHADIRVDENGDTWIRVEIPGIGAYEYNKTKMDADVEAAINKPIKFGMDMRWPDSMPWREPTLPRGGRGVYVSNF